MRVANLLINIFDRGTSCGTHGLVEIDGIVNGMIRKGNSVLINPSGRFCGRIEAKNLELAGVVQGDVEAETLVIHSSGQLYYDRLNCKYLSVKDGGVLINRGGSESEKASCAEGEEYPGNTTPTDDVRETDDGNLYENSADSNSKLLDDAPGPNGRHGQNEDIQEAIPLPEKTRALQVDEQRPLPNCRQPNFYISY
ncbi:MAG TPA: polymer-forming cytoskeletal protein [Firmicutes bacterium]|nr:polymer-forming cytoskeletal protein [Bacillota bacterium]